MIGGPFVNIEDRGGEAESTLADISRATDILNWKPRVKLAEWIHYNKPW